MTYILVVVRPFGLHRVGDRITAPADITSILTSDHRHSVVQVNVPTTPATGH